MSLIRLNKYLAQMGVASRRKIDDITIGRRITINGNIAILGDKVDPDNDIVIVDKKIIKPHPQNLVYYLLNKPKFVLSTSVDDRGRKTVLKLIPPTPRVFPVGRLDFESTGLIILTNDGDLAQTLTHPRYHLPKTYLLTCIGKITPGKLEQFRRGVLLDDGKTSPADIEVLPSKLNQNQLRITLYQGKKRQIRRMCSALRLHVLDLQRIAIGSIEIGDLKPGQYRLLSPAEVRMLK